MTRLQVSTGRAGPARDILPLPPLCGVKLKLEFSAEDCPQCTSSLQVSDPCLKHCEAGDHNCGAAGGEEHWVKRSFEFHFCFSRLCDHGWPEHHPGPRSPHLSHEESYFIPLHPRDRVQEPAAVMDPGCGAVWGESEQGHGNSQAVQWTVQIRATNGWCAELGLLGRPCLPVCTCTFDHAQRGAVRRWYTRDPGSDSCGPPCSRRCNDQGPSARPESHPVCDVKSVAGKVEPLDSVRRQTNGPLV